MQVQQDLQQREEKHRQCGQQRDEGNAGVVRRQDRAP